MEKPKMGDVVIYNHGNMRDGVYLRSPAIVMKPLVEKPELQTCNLFVMSNTNGVFFATEIPHGYEKFISWSWPDEAAPQENNNENKEEVPSTDEGTSTHTEIQAQS